MASPYTRVERPTAHPRGGHDVQRPRTTLHTKRFHSGQNTEAPPSELDRHGASGPDGDLRPDCAFGADRWRSGRWRSWGGRNADRRARHGPRAVHRPARPRSRHGPGRCQGARRTRAPGRRRGRRCRRPHAHRSGGGPRSIGVHGRPGHRTCARIDPGIDRPTRTRRPIRARELRERCTPRDPPHGGIEQCNGHVVEAPGPHRRWWWDRHVERTRPGAPGHWKLRRSGTHRTRDPHFGRAREPGRRHSARSPDPGRPRRTRRVRPFGRGCRRWVRRVPDDEPGQCRHRKLLLRQ